MEKLTPDICVIGGGAAGLSVAAAAAAFGVPAVLIERRRMGGECLNAGCVPSKALLAAAQRAHDMRNGGAFGVHTAEVHVDFAKVRAHVRSVIDGIAPTDSAERFTGLGVRVLQGEARFKDKRTVAVGEEFEIRARRTVIATGSMPAVPKIPGLNEVPYFTTETIFDLDVLPSHLVVIGAGATGLELAQAFRRLGSGVTVLDAGPALAQDDPECVDILLAQLEREGIVIHTGVTVTRISHAIGHVGVTIARDGKEEMVGGSHLLIAAGRRPVLDALNLKMAGVRHDDSGILVGRNLKTSNSRVYAIGDVAAGQPRFTHAASYQAGVVIRNALFRQRARVEPELIPHAIFTEPELAQAGLTETQARARRLSIRVLRRPYHENDRAQAERQTHGHIKIVADRKGRIVGTTIVGAQAGEMIGAWALGIAQGLSLRNFAELVLPYPTLSEVGKRAAIDFYVPHLTQPLLRRIINFVRILDRTRG
jgi:pyruvate/2-oxoglutarate dehydrogenase complex dihydrolipoamide dehydrogenase (E3) component